MRKNLQKTFEHSFRKFLLIVNLSLVAGAVFGNALRIFINISCFWEKKILFKSMPIQFVYYFIGLAVFFSPLVNETWDLFLKILIQFIFCNQQFFVYVFSVCQSLFLIPILVFCPFDLIFLLHLIFQYIFI